MESPTDAYLTSVVTVSSDDGWAVGRGGTILRWDGENWSVFESPTHRDLYSVAMVSSDDGWAVGEDAVILRWRSGDGSPLSNRVYLPTALTR